ncbi:MAG: prepilin-type N-terminal cleavage/methylation domain-containing protein [Verrucomicrobiota bacterium]
MISAARTIERRAGFTLLEIVIVITIAAVVLAGAVGMMVFSTDERILGNASGEVELLAKRARVTAMLKQTPYALEFREGVVRLLPLALAGMDEKETAGGRAIGGETEEPSATEFAEYPIPAEIGLSVRRWNSEKWLPAHKNAIHIWRFDPNGINEPLAVRFATGESWLEDTFHPLTATIRDTRSEIR